MEGNVTVYTAVVGEYDEVLAPTAINPGCAYLCYTDQAEGIPQPWERLRVAGLNLNWPSEDGAAKFKAIGMSPAHLVRIHKILAEWSAPGSYSIWLDANIQLAADPVELCERYLKDSDIAAFGHPWRQSLYEEADLLIQMGYHDPAPIRKQVERYRGEGCPETSGLWCGGILLRRHTSRMIALNTAWWNEVLHESARDQVSLPYVCWKLGVRPATISDSIYKSKEFVFHDHIHNRRNAASEERGALDTRSA